LRLEKIKFVSSAKVGLVLYGTIFGESFI